MNTCTSWVARVLALALVCTIASPAVAEDAPISDEARQHFSAGVNLLQDPDGARYEEAYREFKTAYAASPSWKILGNLGITAMKLERDGEAIDAFSRYLQEGGSQLSAEEREQFERDLQTLQAGLVTITIQSVPPGAVITDERVPVRGEAVVNRYGPLTEPLQLGIRAGHHKITATLGGYQDQTWEFDARPASSESHVFELQKATAVGVATTGTPQADTTSVTRPVPTTVYIGLAATGALAIGAGVFGVLATSKKSDFDDANDGTDPTAAEDLRDSGTQLNLMADIFLGGAVVAGAITTVLFVTRPEVSAKRDTGVTVSPVVGSRGAALSFSGRF